MLKVQPLGDKVLIEVIEEEQKENELFIVKDTTKTNLQKGKVLEVGEGITLNTGEVKPLNVFKDDIVYFNNVQSMEVKSHGTDCKLVSISQVLGKELK